MDDLPPKLRGPVILDPASDVEALAYDWDQRSAWSERYGLIACP
jgi:hypothetical protein